MLGRLSNKTKKTATLSLAQTNAKLAVLQLELAAQNIRLARQTDDIAPLDAAAKALCKARRLTAFEDCPIEMLTVARALADTQLRLGREQKDKPTLAAARETYRAAITLASMLGEDTQRDDIRINLTITDSLLGRRRQAPSLFDAA